MSTIHACGFYTDDRPRVDGMSVAVCPDGETPYQAFTRIRSNIHHFGGEIESIRTMRPIGGGGPVRIEWGSPAHDATARMWHVVTSASADDWKAMTLDPHAEHVAALPTICDQRDAGCCGTPACLNAGVWTDDPYDEPLGVFEGTRWHSHSEPICADPECVTYLTRSAMATMRARADQ